MTSSQRRALLKLAEKGTRWTDLPGSRIYPNTVAKLRDLGYITTNDQRQIALTPAGETVAARLRRETP